jgi:2-phospho-L-lactate transferase/gluconeogenesis factor (CofD/UPF0052 family)
MTAVEYGNQLSITVFGGGGGGSVMAGGLVEAMPGAEVTVIVPTGDSGSKTGELRDTFGGPAVGDARKVLSAVSGNEAGPIFGMRFGEGTTAADVEFHGSQMLDILKNRGKDTIHASRIVADTVRLVAKLPEGEKSLRGHTLGNLMLTAMSQENDGDILPGIKTVGNWLDARAKVVPVTTEAHNVVMYDRVGRRIIKGEGCIDDYTPADPTQVDVWLEKNPISENRFIEDVDEAAAALAREAAIRPTATRDAMGAIVTAKVALLAPGSPWTSHQPALLPEGVAESLSVQQIHNGLWIAVANLIEEKPGLDLGVHLRAIQGSARRAVTHLIHNNNVDGLPEGTIPLHFDPNAFDIGDAKEIGEALVDSRLIVANDNDPISYLRSPSHHNPWKVADVLRGLVSVS